jgi:hypothetical protein
MKRLMGIFAIAAASCLVAAADEKPSIETLFKPAQYASMRISPDGNYISGSSPTAKATVSRGWRTR